MCRDPIMKIYTAHYRGEQVVLLDTKKVRENAMRVTKSRKTRINYKLSNKAAAEREIP